MARSLRHLMRWGGVLVLLAGLFGCGGDEYSPSPARAREDTSTPSADLAYKDLGDLSVTAIELATSAEYTGGQVSLFAQVRDQDKNFLDALNAHNFGLRVDTYTLVEAEDTLLTTAMTGEKLVALVIDTSGSMSSAVDPAFPVLDGGDSRMAVAKEAARLFVGLMGSGDRTAIVEFSTDARIVQQLTEDQDLLNDAIDSLTPTLATNIGGALTEAVRAVGSRPGKRAVVLLTDGDDTVDSVVGGPSVWLNNSDSSRYQGLQLAQDNDLIVYTVGLGDGLSDVGEADLETIAEETGGKYFAAPTAASLLSAFSSTIPNEVDALPPMQTYELIFTNPVLAGLGQQLDVPYLLTVEFENALGTHRAVFDGTYTVQ